MIEEDETLDLTLEQFLMHIAAIAGDLFPGRAFLFGIQQDVGAEGVWDMVDNVAEADEIRLLRYSADRIEARMAMAERSRLARVN